MGVASGRWALPIDRAETVLGSRLTLPLGLGLAAAGCAAAGGSIGAGDLATGGAELGRFFGVAPANVTLLPREAGLRARSDVSLTFHGDDGCIDPEPEILDERTGLW